MLANGGNIATNDHNGIVNGSYSFLKHFDIKLNGKKLYDCDNANHPLISRIYLSKALLMLKKQEVMSFSSLIHPEMQKSGKLKFNIFTLASGYPARPG